MAATLDRPVGPAATRAYLRGGLPAIYRDDDDAFAMRFVAGLEEVLDPIVSLLDSLPAHFDVDLAPPDLLALLMAWLGLDQEQTLSFDAGHDERSHRALAREATTLVRARGTCHGLECLLRLAFPALGVSVEDTGSATSSPAVREAPDAEPPAFVVRTTAASIPRDVENVLRRVILRNAPVHIPGRLQIGPDGEERPLP